MINKNSVNEVVLTLSERTSIINAKYLCELKRDITNDTFYFILKVNSSGLRVEVCEITENDTPNVLNSVISLKDGFYQYKIFEQASAVNLNPSGLNTVEIGKLKVVSVEVEKTKYTQQNNIRVSYER